MGACFSFLVSRFVFCVSFSFLSPFSLEERRICSRVCISWSGIQRGRKKVVGVAGGWSMHENMYVRSRLIDN